MPRNDRPLVAVLSCELWIPGYKRSTLPDHVIQYVEDFEESFDAIKMKGLSHSISSSEQIWDGDCIAYHIDTFTCFIHKLAVIDSAEQEFVRTIRKCGIPRRFQFHLKKQIVLPNEERDIYRRRVYPKRESPWLLLQSPTRLHVKAKPAKGYPKNLRYLEKMAARCNGVGGYDYCGLFPKEDDFTRFFAALSASDHRKLISLFHKIADKQDNVCLYSWLLIYECTDGDYPDWAVEMLWLLGSLDRLTDGGLLADQKGKEVPVLRYWDDYLGGKPYTKVVP